MPSNVTKTLLKTTPLMFGNFSGFTAAKLRGEHSLFDNPNAVRVDCTAAPAGQNGVAAVTFTKAAGTGDTLYLSYFQNEVASVRLSNPPPAGVTMFTTDNLSGCKFFVDTVNGSNDLVVYHANARALSPQSNRGAAFPTLETPAAATELDRLHQQAVTDWAANPHNLVLANGGSVNKPTYNASAELLVRRKDHQGRKSIPNPVAQHDPQRVDKPEYLGGTVIFGFYAANQWKFYYQTWGAVEYRRPKTAPKGWVSGRNVSPTTYRLLGYGRIYPNPYNRTI